MKLNHNRFKTSSIVILLGLITNCSSLSLNPGAEKVQLSHSKADKTCQFLGTVFANQGNAFTGGFTSNANLQEGAFNDLRNKGYAMGGNYIQIIANQAGVTGSGGGDLSGFGSRSQQTNYTVTGSVFKCPRVD